MLKNIKSLFIPLLLLIVLPALLFAVQKILELRKSAAIIPANIIVDAAIPEAALPTTLWQNFSQGGEESRDMIGPVVPQIKKLQPKLIRIDHIFDYYQVEQNGSYNFSRLDQAVDSILATGAVPMLSISYTPDSKAPSNWDQWHSLVQATARHYSVDRKISGIYYEVWNEPDLFGGWHYGKDPNYLTLYAKTSSAVVAGAGNSNYKIGGPATTAYYNNWIKSLFKFCSNNNLRLDFISWHQYSKDMESYESDFNDLNSIIAQYPRYFNIERLITEMGPNPEPDPWYDNSLSGVHLLSTVTHLAGKIHRLFIFEPVDGPTPRSDKSTGWGLITHTSNGSRPKPRYYAIELLNRLGGFRLNSSGDGTFITSLSSKKLSTIQTLLVNYDASGRHSETFPLTYQNLAPGKYRLTTSYYLGQTTTKTIEVTGAYREAIYLEPNTAMLVELNLIQQ